MDKYQITVGTFDKLAQKYQDKYMHMDFYQDTYDTFCNYITKHNAHIFEIGCGPGNITQYLLNKLPKLKIIATDLSPNMVALAKQNNPQAECFVLDSRDINKVKQTFDAIMCGFCLPYLSKNDIKCLIKDSQKILNPDGIIYLSTMEDYDNKSGFQTSSSGDQVYIHYHQSEFLVNTLLECGFEILDTTRKSFPAEIGTPATDLFIIAKLKE